MGQRQLLSTLLISVLVTAGCSQSVTQTTANPTTTISPHTTSLPAATATTTSTTAPEAVSSSVPSTTQPSEPAISDCPSPSPTTDDDSYEYVRLHVAVAELLASTNQLGHALLDVTDYTAGWERSEQVAQIVDTIHADLDSLDREAAAILSGTFGATFDPEGMWWQFPKSLWPVSPELASLEQVSLGVYEYRDTILPLLFTFSDRTEVIEHWNYGASPCGHAFTLGLLLENARPVLNS